MSERKITPNRKLDIKKSGNSTRIRNKYGSEYKKLSKLERTFTDYDTEGLIDVMKDISKLDTVKGINKYINEHEKRVLDWLERSGLPTDDRAQEFSFTALSKVLSDDHQDHKGAYEASEVLGTVNELRSTVNNEKYKDACLQALNLSVKYQMFLFAIYEPTLSAGKKNLTGFANTILSDDQLADCFKYFESLTKTKEGRRYLKGEKWDKTVEYAMNKYSKKVSESILRKRYKHFS